MNRHLSILLQVGLDPLKVAVQHLKDLPYNANDDVLRATSMEMVATLKVGLATLDVLACLWFGSHASTLYACCIWSLWHGLRMPCASACMGCYITV